MAKATKTLNLILPDEVVMNKICVMRGQKVMLDEDLSELYQVETKRLKEAVRRNIDRFPSDFMFELGKEEFESLRSQIATSKRGGTRYLPMAFTEQGVSMLSSVLNSSIAIQVNIQIIRIFTKMRELLLTHKDIFLKLEKLEKEMIEIKADSTETKRDVAVIFKTLKQLIQQPVEKRRRIGFKSDEDHNSKQV